MATEAFISYAHADDARRERLSKHLAMLRRDGLLEAWSDHEILPGDRLDVRIDAALEQSALFIALLSPDYLESKYCYDIEFKHARERDRRGQMRIVGVVVEPCDWKNSPFRDLLVLPKDGKAVPLWTNENTAYLNVAEELRKLLSTSGAKGAALPAQVQPDNARPTSRLLKVKQDFDAIQRGEFADGAFALMLNYFRSACSELDGASDHIRTKFEEMSKTAFTCTIVNRAKIRGNEAHITVSRRKGGRMSAGEISYVFAAHTDDGSSNGFLTVQADDYRMFFQGVIGYFGTGGEETFSPESAAEALWNAFMMQAGIEFES